MSKNNLRFLVCFAYKEDEEVKKVCKIMESRLKNIYTAQNSIINTIASEYNLKPELAGERTYEDDEVGIFYVSPKTDNTIKNLRDTDIDDELARYEHLENMYESHASIR